MSTCRTWLFLAALAGCSGASPGQPGAVWDNCSIQSDGSLLCCVATEEGGIEGCTNPAVQCGQFNVPCGQAGLVTVRPSGMVAHIENPRIVFGDGQICDATSLPRGPCASGSQCVFTDGNGDTLESTCP